MARRGLLRPSRHRPPPLSARTGGRPCVDVICRSGRDRGRRDDAKRTSASRSASNSCRAADQIGGGNWAAMQQSAGQTVRPGAGWRSRRLSRSSDRFVSCDHSSEPPSDPRTPTSIVVRHSVATRRWLWPQPFRRRPCARHGLASTPGEPPLWPPPSPCGADASARRAGEHGSGGDDPPRSPRPPSPRRRCLRPPPGGPDAPVPRPPAPAFQPPAANATYDTAPPTAARRPSSRSSTSTRSRSRARCRRSRRRPPRGLAILNSQFVVPVDNQLDHRSDRADRDRCAHHRADLIPVRAGQVASRRRARSRVRPRR